MTHDTTLARGAERGGASGSKPIIIINKQARASRQVHIARAPLMTAACATDEAPTRHTRTDVQRRESDDLSTGRSVFDLSLSGPPLAASEGLGPLNKKQKQSDLNAILWPKLLETCGFPSVFHGLWSPNQQCNQPITPSTDSTDPARPLPSTTRSGDRSTAFPPLDPPLALGLAAL